MALVLGAVVLGVVLNVRALIRRTRQEESSAREREVERRTRPWSGRRRSGSAWSGSRAVLANALEQSADAVAIADTDAGASSTSTPAFERITGRPAADASGPGSSRRCAPGRPPRPEGQPLLASHRRGGRPGEG